MMSTIIFIILLESTTAVMATPIEAANLSVQTLAAVNRTGITHRAAAIGCIIRAWSGANCDGTNWAAYEYSPDLNSCRSCRSNGGVSHSFGLEANCPYEKLWASQGGNCDGDNGAIHIHGVGCYSVDTGYGWLSLRPCFGQ